MTTKHTGNKRLLKLAEFLDRLPPKRFDYSIWVGEDWQGAQDLSCGTTGCALGWAAAMPEFQKLGVKLVGQSLMSVQLEEAVRAEAERRPPNLTECMAWAKVIWPDKKCSESFDTAAELFGLEGYEATDLFTPESNEYKATPKYVAKKIRKFVKGRK